MVLQWLFQFHSSCVKDFSILLSPDFGFFPCFQQTSHFLEWCLVLLAAPLPALKFLICFFCKTSHGVFSFCWSWWILFITVHNFRYCYRYMFRFSFCGTFIVTTSEIYVWYPDDNDIKMDLVLLVLIFTFTLHGCIGLFSVAFWFDICVSSYSWLLVFLAYLCSCRALWRFFCILAFNLCFILLLFRYLVCPLLQWLNLHYSSFFGRSFMGFISFSFHSSLFHCKPVPFLAFHELLHVVLSSIVWRTVLLPNLNEKIKHCKE